MTSASAIIRIDLVVSDLIAAAQFYEAALGFELIGTTRAGRRRLRLGTQEVELRACPASAAPYPAPRAANDPWFQHFAIAVSDMAAAYERLCRHPHEAISEGGPQRLPPSTGSVTAYKFRDPDGHPLELSHIPDSQWSGQPGGPFLGIDHSAIAVADPSTAIAFYEGLGLTVSGRGRNRGPEQDRLDGLIGVDLEIISMHTQGPGPHLELLHYSRPLSPHPLRTWSPDDIAATRLVLAGNKTPATARDPDRRLVEIAGG